MGLFVSMTFDFFVRLLTDIVGMPFVCLLYRSWYNIVRGIPFAMGLFILMKSSCCPSYWARKQYRKNKEDMPQYLPVPSVIGRYFR